MKENLKDYFHFSKGEKNGIIVLLLILFILIILPNFSSLLIEPELLDKDAFKEEIAAFNNSLIEKETPSTNNRLNQYIVNRYDSLKLFHFNPNNTSDEEFKKLGLTEKQIKTINNYLNKGGKFHIKDDFRKIYGIRNQQFLLLKPYILLPSQKPTSTKTDKKIIFNTDSMFVFDPNTATEEEFLSLGFSKKQISTIKNYLKKIGSFKITEDFKKVYGISEKQFNRVAPYINIKIKEQAIEKEIKITLDLNSATIEELIKIKGIGTYTAKAIIKYRKKLGGFVNTSQLLEINKLNKDYYNEYKGAFKIDLSKIEKMSLNFFEIEDFIKHPYLNYTQSKKIVEFRTKNGPYKNIQQLLKENILTESNFYRIQQYFSVN